MGGQHTAGGSELEQADEGLGRVIIRQFKICAGYTKPDRWFWVRIYDTAESLRYVANRLDGWRNGTAGQYDDCVGCVQEVTPWIPEDMDPRMQDSVSLHSRLKWPEDGFAGVIRFCAEWLTPEIIAHEITHAALVVHRMNLRQRPLLEGMLAPERPNEEALAYAVGQLATETYEALHAIGMVWTRVDCLRVR